MNRLDSHIHLFEYGFSGRREAGAELAEYEVLRSRHHISKSLVVGFEGDSAFAGNNDYVLALARKHEWVLPFVYLDVRRTTVDVVETAVEAGAAGFSLYLGADSRYLGEVDPALWRAIDAHHMVMSVNAQPTALAEFQSVLERLESTDVLISHLGLPGPASCKPSEGSLENLTDFSRIAPLRELARFPRVTVKLSGLYAIDVDFPYQRAESDVSAVLDAFGLDRLVWGSDFAPGLEVATADELFDIPEWLTSLVTSEELARVMGGTLKRMLERD